MKDLQLHVRRVRASIRSDINTGSRRSMQGGALAVPAGSNVYSFNTGAGGAGGPGPVVQAPAPLAPVQGGSCGTGSV